MISDRNIVCFASGWDYHPTSKHHIMRKLAEQNNVVWVNWHASRRPAIGWSDLRNMVVRLWQIRRGARQVADSISVLTPCQLPFPGSPLACQLNARMVRRAVQKVLDGLPHKPVQLWTFAPDIADILGQFNEELVLYYCVDAFGEFPGYNRDLIKQREHKLIDRSDVVITTSPPLYESKRGIHSNVHLVQHGVDHNHLSRAVPRQLPVPKELKTLPRPIFGFVGIVGEWVDLDLVAGLAKRFPAASIVLIGPEMRPRGACNGLSNIHWFGPRQHQMLPAYLQCFDVGLIPFKQVPLTYNANPIKLYEYLAAGVPAVSSTLPAVSPMPGDVWLADDIETLANSCAAALKINDRPTRERRSQLMLAESWTARLEQISRIVNKALCDKAPSADAISPPPELQSLQLSAS